MRVSLRKSIFRPTALLVLVGSLMCASFVASADPLSVLYVPIRGTVTDRAGTPLEGVRISDGDKSTWTASDGTYVIEEPILNGFSLNASRLGLRGQSRSDTALPGTKADFEMYYTIDLSQLVSGQSVDITVGSFAPSNSCAEWTDESTAQTIALELTDSESGKSTWTGTFQSAQVPGAYKSRAVVRDCTSNTPLTEIISGEYSLS